MASGVFRPSHKKVRKAPERYVGPGEPYAVGSKAKERVAKAREAYAALKAIFKP